MPVLAGDDMVVRQRLIRHLHSCARSRDDDSASIRILTYIEAVANGTVMALFAGTAKILINQ
jgi:hypothetical protein